MLGDVGFRGFRALGASGASGALGALGFQGSGFAISPNLLLKGGLRFWVYEGLGCIPARPSIPDHFKF